MTLIPFCAFAVRLCMSRANRRRRGRRLPCACLVLAIGKACDWRHLRRFASLEGPRPTRYLHSRQKMAPAQFSFPKQWEDWCSWLLGIWLCISPWALHFSLESTATQATVIPGLLIILAEVVTLSIFYAWEEWINVMLGVWLIICPWILVSVFQPPRQILSLLASWWWHWRSTSFGKRVANQISRSEQCAYLRTYPARADRRLRESGYYG